MTHLRHLLDAFRYSLHGLESAFKDEMAFRQIVLCAAIGIPAAVFLAGSWTEMILLILPLILAIIVELLNTAVESVVDRISMERHPLAKKAKDTASAAQFCAQIFALFVWGSHILTKAFY